MSFLTLTSLADFPDTLKGGVVAIGNFDGVHRGHQAVLSQAVNLAKANGVSATVLTFEPHPRTFFKPDAPLFRLTDAHTKANLFEALGFDCVVQHAFNSALSSTLAEDFVKSLLVDAMAVSHVVTGYDFHFGKGRGGSPQFLQEAGAKHSFSALIVSAFTDEGGGVISSSRIRECLANANLAEANALLGYSYRVSGEVIKGQQLGRTLGYPTANITLPPEATLAHGIYAVRARLADGSLHDGVASYGRRPTFDNGEALLETFVFDFSGDLYGQEITIYLESWLRGEEKFDSAEALVEQMDKDSQEAKAYLAMLGPQQGLTPIVAG
jgi:riboflavin kinase/FMN adenylyltransferase